MVCDNQKKNKSFCTCTYEPCSRKYRCCECLQYHWRSEELPACLFPAGIEKTYDRSLRAFINYYKDRC